MTRNRIASDLLTISYVKRYVEFCPSVPRLALNLNWIVLEREREFFLTMLWNVSPLI